MKCVSIIALTEIGAKAIELHIEESKKLKLRHRLLFKKSGYKQIISDNDPLTLDIEITNPYLQEVLKKEQFLAEINKAMQENGAKENIDYKLEVE